MIRLTRHFRLQDFTFNELAVRQGIDNHPSPEHLLHLVDLCDQVLEPIYEEFGPLTIVAGYHCQRLHRSYGTADAKLLDGHAVDICICGVTPADLSAKLATMRLPIDDLVYEYGQWAHVGRRTGSPRGLVRSRDRIGYRPGIVEPRKQ